MDLPFAIPDKEGISPGYGQQCGEFDVSIPQDRQLVKVTAPEKLLKAAESGVRAMLERNGFCITSVLTFIWLFGKIPK